MKSRNNLGKGLLAGVAVVAIAAPHVVAAQTVRDRVTALEQKVEENRQELSSMLGIDMHALISTIYQYSLNRPEGASPEVPLRFTTGEANGFILNQATLVLGRDKEDEEFAFEIKLDFGEFAKNVGTDWGSTSENTDAFELRTANVTYKPSWANGISITGGKFETLLGYEVLPSPGAINHSVSRSILFFNSVPFTHVGLIANIPLGDMVGFDIGVVNGWDNAVDNNDGKSLLMGLGIAPADIVSMYFASIVGPEEDDNGKSKTATVTANVTVMPTDILTFVVDGVFGYAGDVEQINRPGVERESNWYGVAAYAIVQVHPNVSLSLRGEIFDDADGFKTGFVNTATGNPGVTVWEVTPSITVNLTETVTFRMEYRHDEANTGIFPKDPSGDSFQNGSDTFAGELILEL